jgi:hypothetical protein
MKPTQKELNEFLLDFVELLGKHFPAWSDKTRVAGGNEGVSIRIRRAASGSELEIVTDRLDPCIEFEMTGGAQALRRFRKESGSRETLFAAIQGELMGLFSDRIAVLRGFKGDARLGDLYCREDSDESAIDAFRREHPGCDRVILKRWSRPERDFPL